MPVQYEPFETRMPPRITNTQAVPSSYVRGLTIPELERPNSPFRVSPLSQRDCGPIPLNYKLPTVMVVAPSAASSVSSEKSCHISSCALCQSHVGVSRGGGHVQIHDHDHNDDEGVEDETSMALRNRRQYYRKAVEMRRQVQKKLAFLRSRVWSWIDDVQPGTEPVEERVGGRDDVHVGLLGGASGSYSSGAQVGGGGGERYERRRGSGQRRESR